MTVSLGERAGTTQVEVLGARLEYRWIGPGPAAAPTIVFLHEALGSVSTWKDFPDRLAAESGCGALVYGRAGHGRSGPLPAPRTDRYLHEEALDVLPRVLERFGIGNAVLFGHSDGASIALIAAGAGAAPVRAVVAEAPHVFVEEEALAGIRRTLEAWETTNLRERLARHHGDNTESVFRAWADTWLRPSFRSWNIESYLSPIACSVLVIQGAGDSYGTLRQVEAVVSRTGGPARSLVLPGCGHAPHIERAEEVLEAASGFFRAALAAGG